MFLSRHSALCSELEVNEIEAVCPRVLQSCECFVVAMTPSGPMPAARAYFTRRAHFIFLPVLGGRAK